MNTTSAHVAPRLLGREVIRRLELQATRPATLRRVRRVGLTILAVQLATLLVWSSFEAARHVQGPDFVGFYRAFYLISHGTLVPTDWFQAQAVLIQWPLALLGLIWPHPITLLVVQDLAIVGAEAVAFLWICDLVAERQEVPATAYCLIGLALLALDPWIYWSASWDYHSEPLGTLFAVLAARDLFRGRRIAALWCVLTLMCGLVPATYLVGVGLSLLIARRRRVVGGTVALTGVVWFELMVRLGAGGTLSNTSTVHGTEAAVSVTSRISLLIPEVWHHWLDVLANAMPAGLLGLFTAPVIGIAGVTLGENFSQGNPNALVPSFQGIPLYIFVPIGTIVALMWLRRRFGVRLANVLATAAVLNVVGWGAVWIPKTVPTWLRVSPAQSEAISHIEAMIPRRDGVVASQGIVGDFAGRNHFGVFDTAPTTLPITGPYTWFVIAPYAGIETATVAQSAQLIANLARDPNAKLKYVSNASVWAFRVRASSAGASAVQVGGISSSNSAGLFATYGTAVRRGRMRSWYMEGSDRAPGPILWGDYYLEPVGRYRAQVRLAGSGRVSVQLWNATTNRELAAKSPVLSGSEKVSLSGAITKLDPTRSARAQRGIGPFQIDPVRAARGNVLEVLVYAESAATIRVQWVSLRPAAK